MKKQSLLLMIACSALLFGSAEAQSNMQVYDRAGVIDNYSTYDVRKITFDSLYTMTVHETNTNKAYYAIDTIRKIIFNTLPTSNSEVPGQVKQLKIYPNPASDILNIEYSLQRPAKVVLQIFNIYGVLIKNENIANQATGAHKYIWNGTNNSGNLVASGTYVCHLSIDGKTSTEKIIIIN